MSKERGTREHTLRTPYPKVYEKATGNTLCNICQRTVDALTEDHVPPKSCLLDPNVELEPFEHRLQAKKPRLPWSQSGVRYRTICASCNALMGRTYDPALAQFWKRVHDRLRSVIAVAPTWTIWCNADLVVRAVFGHLLAAITDDAQTTTDQAMRPAVLDPRVPLPADLGVFYWLHPHQEVTVLRGLGMPAARGRNQESGIFDIMKFAPLGFLVTDLMAYEGLPRLDDVARSSGARDVEVRFQVDLLRKPDWPDCVDDGNFLMFGRSVEDGVIARPRGRKGKHRRSG